MAPPAAEEQLELPLSRTSGPVLVPFQRFS
jgi:hypothetical protein